MNPDDLIRRLSADLQDSYDEELEMEIEDRIRCRPTSQSAATDAARLSPALLSRLFKLQAELVKLQDWIVDSTRRW